MFSYLVIVLYLGFLRPPIRVSVRLKLFLPLTPDRPSFTVERGGALQLLPPEKHWSQTSLRPPAVL